MAQENRPERPNRPGFEITTFKPQIGGDVSIYHKTPDLDQKALVLNRQIVKVEGVTATPESVRTVAMIAASQERSISQYRADAVVGLTGENLIAMANGLSSDEQEMIDPLSGAIRRIQQVVDNESLRSVGISSQEGSSEKDEDIKNLEEDIFGELAERLDSEYGDEDRRGLIATIDAMITPQTLKRISERGDVLGSFIRASREFRNEELRNALKRIRERQDL